MTTEEGEKLQKKIYAFAYVECSAKEDINLSRVLEEAVRASLCKNLEPLKGTKKCQIIWFLKFKLVNLWLNIFVICQWVLSLIISNQRRIFAITCTLKRQIKV